MHIMIIIIIIIAYVLITESQFHKRDGQLLPNYFFWYLY